MLQQRINQEIINEWKNKNNTDFDDSDYVQYAILGQYKNDYSLIEKIPSNCEYIATLIINQDDPGIARREDQRFPDARNDRRDDEMF